MSRYFSAKAWIDLEVAEAEGRACRPAEGVDVLEFIAT